MGISHLGQQGRMERCMWWVGLRAGKNADSQTGRLLVSPILKVLGEGREGNVRKERGLSVDEDFAHSNRG